MSRPTDARYEAPRAARFYVCRPRPRPIDAQISSLRSVVPFQSRADRSPVKPAGVICKLHRRQTGKTVSARTWPSSAAAREGLERACWLYGCGGRKPSLCKCQGTLAQRSIARHPLTLTRHIVVRSAVQEATDLSLDGYCRAWQLRVEYPR